jgi:predicted lipoprotein with Yx(FWY)xxD motif
MKWPLSLLAAVAMAAFVPAGLAGARVSHTELKLRKTSVGTILVDSRGFTLYAFTPDRRNHDSCASIPHCLAIWPALTATGKPIAGPGVKRSLIGTIKVGGQRQVTYAGHPLYRYVADTGPGQTFYINILQFGGRWPAVNRAGNEVT